jgi:hypothetical protein
MRTLNQGRECPLHAPPAALKPWRATAHRSGTHNPNSHKRYTQYPVGTSKERSQGDSQRACRHDVAQGTKVPHDGPAEVPIRLDVGRHKCVQMAGMRAVLIPVTQRGSSASRLGGGGNVGRAARMNHGDNQRGGTMGRGKVHLNVSMCPLMANRGHANGSVTGLCTRIAARAGGDAESLLPVVVPTRAAAAEALAYHGVVDVAALDVTTRNASGGGDVRVVASCAKAEVATVDEVAVGETEIRGDRDGVQVSPSMPALETEQARATRWGVAGSEEFCSRALSQCLRKRRTHCPDLSVCQLTCS